MIMIMVIIANYSEESLLIYLNRIENGADRTDGKKLKIDLIILKLCAG